MPDTSCTVAVLCTWHEHHDRAMREIERRMDLGHELIMAAPSLVETYAVLTRLPPPRRFSPVACRTALEASFMADTVETIALEAPAYRQLLREAPERLIAGGSLYDAVIIACALVAKSDVILTFNERHFRALVPASIELVVPS